jgi:hypothetical protein
MVSVSLIVHRVAQGMEVTERHPVRCLALRARLCAPDDSRKTVESVPGGPARWVAGCQQNPPVTLPESRRGAQEPSPGGLNTLGDSYRTLGTRSPLAGSASPVPALSDWRYNLTPAPASGTSPFHSTDSELLVDRFDTANDCWQRAAYCGKRADAATDEQVRALWISMAQDQLWGSFYKFATNSANFWRA